MTSWIILILLLAACVVAGTWIFGRILGRGELIEPPEPTRLMESNAQAIDEARTDDIRFEIVHRGYKPEQVDAVIEHLLTQIEQAHKQKGVE